MRKKFYLTLTVLLCSIFFWFAPMKAQAERISSENLSPRKSIEQIKSSRRIASFQQVNFDFAAGRVTNTDWGQFQVDPQKLKSLIHKCSGYVNVFLYTDSRARSHWTVENMLISSEESDICPSDLKENILEALESSDFRNAPSILRSLNQDPLPISAYFDLRPDTDGDGPLDSLQATVLFSRQPLPFLQETMDFVNRTFQPEKFKVEPVMDNAEGDLSEIAGGSTALPISAEIPALLVGLPPQPSTPPFNGPDLDLAFPISGMQSTSPNVNAGINQCVPMAHANNLKYLQYRYNHLPLLWKIPHIATRGVGAIDSIGDVIFWKPVPDYSLIANVDARTRRAEVKDLNTGKGSDRCQGLTGVMTYIGSDFGEQATVVFRHQGGDPLYGAGAECDDGPFTFGDYTSAREGSAPTWVWIFDQLQKGRGVIMSFSRYDPSGNFTGGHMLRVYGASKINNKHYLHTLDDGNQGDNFEGLRVQAFKVQDTGQPGLAGIPDGFLNIDNTNWEIRFAMSVEAKPTLLIP